MATGSDMDISPVRIGKFPMTAGSLQRIYLSTRESFMNVFTGEELSRYSRLMLVDRPLKRYTQKIVALAPPILLQYRYGSDSQEELLCKVNKATTLLTIGIFLPQCYSLTNNEGARF